jgi:hypothetical protein
MVGWAAGAPEVLKYDATPHQTSVFLGSRSKDMYNSLAANSVEYFLRDFNKDLSYLIQFLLSHSDLDTIISFISSQSCRRHRHSRLP